MPLPQWSHFVPKRGLLESADDDFLQPRPIAHISQTEAARHIGFETAPVILNGQLKLICYTTSVNLDGARLCMAHGVAQRFTSKCGQVRHAIGWQIA